MARTFRSTASFEAEKITRSMLVPFLQAHGFTQLQDNRQLHGETESQTIRGIDPSGRTVALRVKLCWRRERAGDRVCGYSATQLLAHVDNDAWIPTLDAFIARLRKEEVTDLLIVQRESQEISHAALVPLDAVTSVWTAQRQESARLIASGQMGKRKKNHAENGRSPTLWLQDDTAASVAEKLWQHPRVSDLNLLPVTGSPSKSDDSFDDLSGFDPDLLGRDEAARIPRVTSGVPRDPAVRQAVLKRSGHRCERPSCGAHRPYPGFLDVHHILGVEKADRVRNCVALCPNCHREAPASPDSDKLNRQLLEYAELASKTPPA